ncbi:MAG: 16S rRNA (cytosine(1402)-N(4))-methyltransferase, partial [Eubacteriales bacterium]|nr:16S rRNA (cytosine(1402)-N(4))-methyltransferase [Eubacteriales bacterium]
MENTEHKRRKHYSGKYPKHFEEKYKEHQPERYAETIEHVIEKGNTPAGMHISICVKEILEVLNIKPGERGLDCTFGYGGHTEAMLKVLLGEGHITSLDIDPIESTKTIARLRQAGYGEDILNLRNINFKDIDLVAAESGPFDFVLADLGVSSMQIDDPERGFSYKVSGPLDLRMNPDAGEPASERLKKLSKDDLIGMLTENADEPYAVEIASAIVKARKSGKSIERTEDLRAIIEESLDFLPAKPAANKKEVIKKSCQRTFQAIRIDVNQEFESL